MNRITSLEILPTGWEYETAEELADIYPVRIRINGGVVPTSSGDVEVQVPSLGTPYKDGFVFEALPVIMDQDLMDTLFTAVDAQDSFNANKIRSYYVLKDATEETLRTCAYGMLASQFCDSSAAEQYIDENGYLLDINGDGTVDEQDAALVGRKRSLAEAEALVAALPEDVREELLEKFMEQAKDDILSLFPYADERPMYLVDNKTKPRESTQLLLIMQKPGLLENRVLTEPVVDLADTALMPLLNMLYVHEAFTTVNAPVQ
jgi:hypothetical protein